MKNEKVNKVDEIYDKYETLMINRIACDIAAGGLVVIGVAAFLANPVSASRFVSLTISLMGVGLGYTIRSTIAKQIHNFRESHREYNLPKSILKVDYEHKKALKKVKKEQRQLKNDYIKKCETVKREVTSPVHADLYYFEEPEKVKVKVKTR